MNKLPEGNTLQTPLEFVKGDEKEILWALVKEYRARKAEADACPIFDWKLAEPARKTKERIWQIIEKGIQ